MLVVEPRAVARLPRGCTNHAELSRAATVEYKFRAIRRRKDILPGHVIAALLQLHHSPTAVASLPALVLCQLHEAIGLLIPRAFPSRVEFAVAEHAHFGITAAAPSILSSVRQIHTYLRWLDPFAASFCWAVESVGRGILLIFLVPKLLEFVIEQTLDIFQGYVLSRAAGRGHMLWVANGEGELALEARVTHAVSAS
jgi:hypothetical protein